MSMTCENCGGATYSRGYGDKLEYVRKHKCQKCGHVFYTAEVVMDEWEGKRRYAECRKYHSLKRNTQ